MQVPFVYGPGDLRLCDVAPPRPGPRDVVLRVAATGICGSDLGYVAAGGVAGPAAQPFPLGHELAGTVVEAGAEVCTVGVGDRVILNPLVNLVGNGGPEGGFGELLLVRDVAGQPGSLLPLPVALSFETGALVEPLAVGLHAVKRLGATPGDKVAVFGAGPIGLMALVALRHRGVDDVVVFDLSAFRRERALALGARAALDPRERPPAETLKALHGAVRVYSAEAPQTSHVLEASGAPLIPEIVAFARAGAVVCVASVQKKAVPVDFQRVLAKELTLTAAIGYPTELAEALELLEHGAVDLGPVVSHRFAGPDFLAAFATAQQPDHAAKVLVQYQDG
ncbi:alcohol dehydrogenase catalytic domain-containing protein [Phenylobacterium sp. LjRoot219]|uniref:zinc-dependent alcohol dehydrogenase n=1 Tax=Phenylobacterium sp. LjRoot219 TaxID=3342283 RepID=UPI003ECDCCF8